MICPSIPCSTGRCRAAERDLSPKAAAKVERFMREGGTILFDTRDSPISGLATGTSPGEATLRRLLAKLDIPPLEQIPEDHVITRTFYLLKEFPGRWSGGQVWVEALPPAGPNAPARGTDRGPRRRRRLPDHHGRQ